MPCRLRQQPKQKAAMTRLRDAVARTLARLSKCLEVSHEHNNRAEIIAIIVLIVLLAIIGVVIYETISETNYGHSVDPGNHRIAGNQCSHRIQNAQRTTLWQFADYPDCATAEARAAQIRRDSEIAAYQLWRQRIAAKRGVALTISSKD